MSKPSINIISDIAGNFDTLQALVSKMPEGYLVAVGDLVDRGPRSREVLEYFKKHVEAGTGTALLGNHEFMMLEALKYGRARDWMNNGGEATLNSFKNSSGDDEVEAARLWVPFLEAMPLSFSQSGLYVSHAPYGEYPESDVFNFVWNRYRLLEMIGYFCVFGHNWNGPKYYKNKNKKRYAVCIDSSAAKQITGLHWPSKKLYHQDWIDT
jgi:hypothetical protein